MGAARPRGRSRGGRRARHVATTIGEPVIVATVAAVRPRWAASAPALLHTLAGKHAFRSVDLTSSATSPNSTLAPKDAPPTTTLVRPTARKGSGLPDPELRSGAFDGSRASGAPTSATTVTLWPSRSVIALRVVSCQGALTSTT